MSFFDMAKQLQSMQGEMKKARAVLATQTVMGKGGNGAVSIELTGTMEVKNVTIDPKLVSKQDVPALEKYVTEAVTDGLRRAQKMATSQLGSLTGLAGKNMFGD
jgi:DNA-binding YbaB/EbfC family protein